MQATAGPDGFLAMSDAADYSANAVLAEYLNEYQKQGGAALERALPRFRKRPKPELAALIMAAHRRIGWIAEHAGELAEPRRWQDRLSQLIRNLYSPGLPFAAEHLVALLKSHRKHRALWSFGPEELVVAFVETNDLSIELADELRRYQTDLKGAVGGMKYQGQAGYQVAVQHVHMLLWYDENDPIDPARCWSEEVRRDLRAMAGERRAAWRALFGHVKGNAPAKPSKGWLVEAERRLERVGREDFSVQLRRWFAPFAASEPQPLGVAGSHVLRGLLWYCPLTKNPEIAALALTLLDARWKAKRNIDKVMVALVGVLEMLPPDEAWAPLLRLRQEWPTTSVQIERLFKCAAVKFEITEKLKAR